MKIIKILFFPIVDNVKCVDLQPGEICFNGEIYVEKTQKTEQKPCENSKEPQKTGNSEKHNQIDIRNGN